MERVIVEFKFEGVVNESEKKAGILLPGSVVFVEDAEGMGLYHAVPLMPGAYMVNLDDPYCFADKVGVIDLIADGIEDMRAS